MGLEIPKLSTALTLSSLTFILSTKPHYHTNTHFTRLAFLPLLTLTFAHLTGRLSLVAMCIDLGGDGVIVRVEERRVHRSRH